MNNKEIKNKVLNIIFRISKISLDELEDNLKQDKLWDSMNHVEIILAIEDEFNICFDQDDLAQMLNAGKIIEYIETNLSKANGS